MKNLVLFCDGGSRGNPGPAASGFVVYEVEESNFDYKSLAGTKIAISDGEFLEITTNNQAEWRAVILGLERILETYGPTNNIQVFLDSELVVKQIGGQYKVKNIDLKPLYNKLKILEQKFNSISFEHVYREFNKEADKVVNQILDSQ